MERVIAENKASLGRVSMSVVTELTIILKHTQAKRNSAQNQYKRNQLIEEEKKIIGLLAICLGFWSRPHDLLTSNGKSYRAT